jgi:hypothetical protein
MTRLRKALALSLTLAAFGALAIARVVCRIEDARALAEVLDIPYRNTLRSVQRWVGGRGTPATKALVGLAILGFDLGELWS